MNALENWYCSTSFWRWITRERLLPWLLNRADLGDHVLEIGAGAGAATVELRRRAIQVVSLEYDYLFAAKLAKMNKNGFVQGDAASLPCADRSFSSAVAVLVLHHLRSSELQDRALAEVHRVLQLGGRFFAFEIPDGWFNRVIHRNSTFVPVQPTALAARLTSAGFIDIALDRRPGGFSARAARKR